MVETMVEMLVEVVESPKRKPLLLYLLFLTDYGVEMPGRQALGNGVIERRYWYTVVFRENLPEQMNLDLRCALQAYTSRSDNAMDRDGHICH